MIKLITPPSLLLTTALLAIFGVYAVRIGTIEDSIMLLTGGAVAAVGTYGTAMMRPWSRYLVYALTAGFVAKLASSLIAAWKIGFFEFQFSSLREIAASIWASAAMTALALWCCWLVHRHFRGQAAAAATSTGTPAS